MRLPHHLIAWKQTLSTLHTEDPEPGAKGLCTVPAGFQDSSVRNSGHPGYWAKGMIEAVPVEFQDMFTAQYSTGTVSDQRTGAGADARGEVGADFSNALVRGQQWQACQPQW